MSTDTKELVTLKKGVSLLESQANEIAITAQKEYEQAIDLVSILKEKGLEIRKRKENITRPLNDALKNARNLFAPIEEQFIRAESIIKAKLLDYKRKVDEEARVKEQAIAKKVEDGRMRLDTAEKKLDSIERVENTTRGKVGEVSIRQIRRVRIVDATLLPREYMIPDDVAIRRDALGGKIIPGVEVYTEEVVAAGSL